MSKETNDDAKLWTAKRKAALIMDIIQGKTTAPEAIRSFDLLPSEIENSLLSSAKWDWYASAVYHQLLRDDGSQTW